VLLDTHRVLPGAMVFVVPATPCYYKNVNYIVINYDMHHPTMELPCENEFGNRDPRPKWGNGR